MRREGHRNVTCMSVFEEFRSKRPSVASRRRQGLTVEALETRQMLAANPIISEFLADNNNTLDDGDGNASDWIEIYNAGDAAIDLAGWHLTDNVAVPAKWTFPSKTLAAGEFFVVFASSPTDAQGNVIDNQPGGAGVGGRGQGRRGRGGHEADRFENTR